MIATITGITAADFDPTISYMHAYGDPQEVIQLHERVLGVVATASDHRIIRNSIAYTLAQAEAGTWQATPDPAVVVL